MQLPLPIEGETVEILLTRDKVAIVDAVDGDLSAFKWTTAAKRDTYYGKRNSNTVPQKTILLHRVILSRILKRELLPSEFVDHKDGNGLNCTRSNLRLATCGENARNQRRREDNTSGFKGVYWDKNYKKWRGQISVNKKQYCLGAFDTPEEAYEAYKKAAVELHGEFARFA